MTFCRVTGAMGVVCVLGLTASAQQSAPAKVTPLVDVKQKRMQPEQALTGAATVNVFGDPSKPGMYVIRRRFGPGQTSRPHYHDQDRWVTVIKGTWWTAEGTTYDQKNMVPIKTGGLMFHPKEFRHYDGARDEEVIVQIMGMGPVRTIQDEKK